MGLGFVVVGIAFLPTPSQLVTFLSVYREGSALSTACRGGGNVTAEEGLVLLTEWKEAVSVRSPCSDQVLFLLSFNQEIFGFSSFLCAVRCCGAVTGSLPTVD